MFSQRDQRQLQQFERMSPSDRVDQARLKSEQLWDFLLELIQTDANNRVVNYSPTLSSQIPRSHAAHAFGNFQRGLLHLELIRLAALWDGPSMDRFSIPTILGLISNGRVRQRLYRKHVAGRRDGTRLLGPEGLTAEELSAARRRIRRSDLAWGRRTFERQLRFGTVAAMAVLHSRRLRSLRDFRDRFIAHNLDPDELAKQGRVYVAPKHGAERRLLVTTCKVTDALNGVTRDTCFAYDHSFSYALRNAKSLWEGCRFEGLS